MLMEWNDALVIGIPEIDEQHKMLLEAMNLLSAELQMGHDRAAFADAQRRLREYTELHFSTEEGLMRETGFRGLERHAERHASFVEAMHRFGEKDMKDAPQEARKLLNYLLDWLVDHILGADVVFAHHYRSHKS